MQLYQSFFINISLLIALAFVLNLLYKYVFGRMSAFRRVPGAIRSAVFAAVLIFGGWLTMMTGWHISDHIMFDLRFVPLVLGVFLLPHPLYLVAVGLGIGAMRLTFGWNEAAVAGFYNLSLLGALSGLLHSWFRRPGGNNWIKGLLIMIILNVCNSLNVAVLGVIPFWVYLTTIAPISLPLGFVLSTFFVFMLRDFYLDTKRAEALVRTNAVLETQKTELQAQKAELQEAKSALEEKARQLLQASRYRSEFLANVSHELKTPLNGIILLSQLIGESDADRFTEEERQQLSMIEASGVELLRHINNILDLSKAEAGKIDIQQEEISLGEVPYILQHQFEREAEQRGLRFCVDTEVGLPDLICTDGMRLNQILRNLLSNAFKFTSAGSVTLSVRSAGHHNGQAHKWVAFSVKDTGIGIAEEKHKLIFEAFRQADSSINRRYGGTGLGLSISLELAKLLGGHLTVASVEGQGSTFTLFLPADG